MRIIAFKHLGLMLALALTLITLLGCEELKQATITYSDGSANVYVLTPEPRIEYRPVKPETSSSGLYDGGEPVNRRISEHQRGKILDAVRTALTRQASHIPDRVKGSGQLSVSHKDGETTVILRQGSPEQAALETALRQSLKD